MSMNHARPVRRLLGFGCSIAIVCLAWPTQWLAAETVPPDDPATPADRPSPAPPPGDDAIAAGQQPAAASLDSGRRFRQGAPSYSVRWYSIDAGGGTIAVGGSFVLVGTTGQPEPGTMAGGSFSVEGGFENSPRGRPCAAIGTLLCDGFESGDTSGWASRTIGRTEIGSIFSGGTKDAVRPKETHAW